MVLQEVTLTFGEERISMKDALKRLVITFQTDSLQVLQDEDESTTTTLSISPVSYPGYLPAWREGRLAFGGLLGEITRRWCAVCLKFVFTASYSLYVFKFKDHYYCAERGIWQINNTESIWNQPAAIKYINPFSSSSFSLFRRGRVQRWLPLLDRLSGEDPGPREGFGPGFSRQTHVNLLPQLPCIDHESMHVQCVD